MMHKSHTKVNTKTGEALNSEPRPEEQSNISSVSAEAFLSGTPADAPTYEPRFADSTIGPEGG